MKNTLKTNTNNKERNLPIVSIDKQLFYTIFCFVIFSSFSVLVFILASVTKLCTLSVGVHDKNWNENIWKEGKKKRKKENANGKRGKTEFAFLG